MFRSHVQPLYFDYDQAEIRADQVGRLQGNARFLQNNPTVRFTISGKPYPFEVGKAYEINNQKIHSVMNMGNEDRISFIFDYVPTEKLPDS